MGCLLQTQRGKDVSPMLDLRDRMAVIMAYSTGVSVVTEIPRHANMLRLLVTHGAMSTPDWCNACHFQ